jgi:hypothetical protein
MIHPQSGDDMVASVTDSSDCTSGFHFGTIDLGQSGYLNSNAIFGGGVRNLSSILRHRLMTPSV